MIRQLMTPGSRDILLKVPPDFVGKSIEIIAFILDEQTENLTVKEDPAPYFVSESLLAKDWLKDEEDEAWKSL